MPTETPLFALGAYAKILRYGDDHVLKVPRDDTLEFRDDCEKDIIHEKEVYAHLGHSRYLVDWFDNDEGIEMVRMDDGNIEDYINTHKSPSQTNLRKLVWRLVCAHCYVHDKNVILYDLFPRNILIETSAPTSSDISLRLCDFGNAILLDKTLDVSKALVDGVSIQIDIFNLGWTMYSLAKWESHSFDLFNPKEPTEPTEPTEGSEDANEDHAEEPIWPELLPDTAKLLCGDIIRKCWTKHAYPNVHAIRDAVWKELDDVNVTGLEYLL